MDNIKKMDLNLLMVFAALCEEKSTTKAALRLGLSQPAISHALVRLRDQLNDPLFVRASKGLVPTNRALELEKPILALLSQLDGLLGSSKEFIPEKAKNIFRMATTDYFELVVLPQLLQKLEKEAPHITIISRPTSGVLPKNELEKGDYDIAIAGFYGKLPEGFMKQKVFDDDFICISKKNHPRIKKKALSIDQYANEKHILISLHGDMKAKTKDILAKKGLDQMFSSGVASFLSPGWIVASTELMLTCPRKLAEAYEKHLPIMLHELPFEIPSISVVQVWHERSHKDPAHSWLRQMIYKTCQEIGR
jgi:DNA-binding transcriptional LysR family regulator